MFVRKTKWNFLIDFFYIYHTHHRQQYTKIKFGEISKISCEHGQLSISTL